MATITPTVVKLASGAVKVTWEAITHADDGGSTALAEVDLSGYPNKTISGAGTFAGSISLALQGSTDGVNWHACHSAGGSIAIASAIAIAAAQAAVVAQNFRWYRLVRSNGSASDVDVVMICAR